MKPNLIDKAVGYISPRNGRERLQERRAMELVKRHYEAASSSQRTSRWKKVGSSANSANANALSTLRNVSRDLERNNPWARRGIRSVVNHTVGWGIMPNSKNEKAMAVWKGWAETTDCDAGEKMNLYQMQRIAFTSMVRDGEVFIRRRPRKIIDGYHIPMQLQVLEADFLDTSKDGVMGIEGGAIIQGVEYDALDRPVAYWMYENHPGDTTWKRGLTLKSNRIPAKDIRHLMRPDRAGQARGISWLAPIILRLKDFDDYEDATLLKQKIAACFVGVIKTQDMSGVNIGEQDTSKLPQLNEQMMQPGTFMQMQNGQEVEFSEPPRVDDLEPHQRNVLRGIAAGLGITYEMLTGDYSQVNYSSARMGRLEFQRNLHEWQYELMIPLFCQPIWEWAMETARINGQVRGEAKAEWVVQPMSMLEPDKEALAAIRSVRGGLLTPSGMLREQGIDPEKHWAEYAADLKKLDDLGIILDLDPRNTTQAGNPRQQASPYAEPSKTES